MFVHEFKVKITNILEQNHSSKRRGCTLEFPYTKTIKEKEMLAPRALFAMAPLRLVVTKMKQFHLMKATSSDLNSTTGQQHIQLC